MKIQQRYILQEIVNISKRELSSLVSTVCAVSSKLLIKRASEQIPLPKPRIEIGSTKSKVNPFAHYYKDIIQQPNRQIRLSFRFANNRCCVFSIKKFEPHGNQFIVTEIVNLNYREIHHTYKNRCVAHLLLTVGTTIALLVPLGTCFFPNTKCSCKLCLHKKTCQFLGRSDYQCPQRTSVCQVCNILFEDQLNSFFWRLAKGWIFSKRVQNQFKMLLELSFVLASIASTETSANLLTVV